MTLRQTCSLVFLAVLFIVSVIIELYNSASEALNSANYGTFFGIVAFAAVLFVGLPYAIYRSSKMGKNGKTTPHLGDPSNYEDSKDVIDHRDITVSLPSGKDLRTSAENYNGVKDLLHAIPEANWYKYLILGHLDGILETLNQLSKLHFELKANVNIFFDPHWRGQVNSVLSRLDEFSEIVAADQRAPDKELHSLISCVGTSCTDVSRNYKDYLRTGDSKPSIQFSEAVQALDSCIREIVNTIGKRTRRID